MSGDFEELRETIKDYYGTAMTLGFPIAIIRLAKVEIAKSVLWDSGFDNV